MTRMPNLWPRPARRQPPGPLRLANFLHIRVIGVPTSLSSTDALRSVLPSSRSMAPPLLPLAAALLVAGPVFVQAPWVRQAPMAAVLFTAVLLSTGVALERSDDDNRRGLGALLVGFAGSWLGGTLFWGWFRLHPLWHMPIEAFALPLALAGLPGRWRLAGAFYLASLLGTAATDGAIALIGLMPSWVAVLQASPEEAAGLLKICGDQVMNPLGLSLVTGFAVLLLTLCRSLRGRGQAADVAAATLATTLAVDGLFLAAAVLAPRLSGLI